MEVLPKELWILILSYCGIQWEPGYPIEMGNWFNIRLVSKYVHSLMEGIYFRGMSFELLEGKGPSSNGYTPHGINLVKRIDLLEQVKDLTLIITTQSDAKLWLGCIISQFPHLETLSIKVMQNVNRKPIFWPIDFPPRKSWSVWHIRCFTAFSITRIKQFNKQSIAIEKMEDMDSGTLQYIANYKRWMIVDSFAHSLFLYGKKWHANEIKRMVEGIPWSVLIINIREDDVDLMIRWVGEFRSKVPLTLTIEGDYIYITSKEQRQCFRSAANAPVMMG